MRAGLLLGLALAVLTPLDAAVYDLAADFSNVSNPNGPWSLRAADGTLFGLHQSDVAGTSWAGDYTGVQPRWTLSTNPNDPPGIAESTGNTALDFPSGSVGGHSGFMIQFTMP